MTLNSSSSQVFLLAFEVSGARYFDANDISLSHVERICDTDLGRYLKIRGCYPEKLKCEARIDGDTRSDKLASKLEFFAF